MYHVPIDCQRELYSHISSPAKLKTESHPQWLGLIHNRGGELFCRTGRLRIPFPLAINVLLGDQRSRWCTVGNQRSRWCTVGNQRSRWQPTGN